MKVGMILGSGLGEVADALEDPVETPGVLRSSVPGHPGSLVRGRRGGTEVLAFRGRRHLYEGATAHEIAAPVRMLASEGVSVLVLTNAAGSLRPELAPGSVVAIADHVNLMGFNPLSGPQFVSLAGAYDPELRARLRADAEGIYLAVRGPSFETPAEIRAFRALGADLVGMSTVPETIVARSLGLRVVGLSLVTNLAEGLSGDPVSHEHTLAAASAGAARMRTVVEGLLDGLA